MTVTRFARAAQRASRLAGGLRRLSSTPRRAAADSNGGPASETGRIDDTLWASNLSPNATAAAGSRSPSVRYADLVQSGAIKADKHQLTVVLELDGLWAALPGHQRRMAAHADETASPLPT